MVLAAIVYRLTAGTLETRRFTTHLAHKPVGHFYFEVGRNPTGVFFPLRCILFLTFSEEIASAAFPRVSFGHFFLTTGVTRTKE